MRRSAMERIMLEASRSRSQATWSGNTEKTSEYGEKRESEKAAGSCSKYHIGKSTRKAATNGGMDSGKEQ
jgi:hypothetical protein